MGSEEQYFPRSNLGAEHQLTVWSCDLGWIELVLDSPLVVDFPRGKCAALDFGILHQPVYIWCVFTFLS